MATEKEIAMAYVFATLDPRPVDAARVAAENHPSLVR